MRGKANDILVKILQQSGSLFKVDLPGINALVSSYIGMIERVLENTRVNVLVEFSKILYILNRIVNVLVEFSKILYILNRIVHN